MNGVKKSNVFVNTSEFEMSHGKRPAGRGLWAFKIGRNDSADQLFWFNGLYSDAKRAAIEQAVERGSYDILVMS